MTYEFTSKNIINEPSGMFIVRYVKCIGIVKGRFAIFYLKRNDSLWYTIVVKIYFMNKIFRSLLAPLILIGSFSIFSSFSNAKVMISKIQIAGVSTTDEFVELYNYSSSSVSLSDWSLKKQTAGGAQSYLVSSFPSSTILNPFGYFLIAHRDYTKINGVAADLLYSNNSTSLAANNSLLLFEEANSLIDEVDWGTVSSTAQPAVNPGAQKSLVRLPNTD